MVDAQILLDEALGSWAAARQNLIAEVENIPPDGLDYRVGEGGRSVAEIVRHVVESGVIFAGEVARADGDFWRAPFSAFHQDYCGSLPEASGRADMIDLLNTTMLQADSTIRAAGAEHMLGSMRGISGAPGTRLATLHFAVAHEFYHAGQIALCARAMGVIPALTKRFQPA